VMLIVPATTPSTSATKQVRLASRSRHALSGASTAPSYVEPKAYGASFSAARRTRRYSCQSSGVSRRVLIAEDKPLERPADQQRNQRAGAHPAPLRSAEARRPGPPSDRTG